MAKAADIDIDPIEPYGRAAARIVRVRADELFAEAENVLDTDDIERVHAMRVASRRLRAVLEIFAPCFPKGEFRGVLRDVKRIADALGLRRDPDVHIAAMESFAGAVGDGQRPGVALLVDSLRRDQQRGNDALAAELERLRTIDLHARLLALADHAEAMAPPPAEPHEPEQDDPEHEPEPGPEPAAPEHEEPEPAAPEHEEPGAAAPEHGEPGAATSEHEEPAA